MSFGPVFSPEWLV